jgi:hypothetical protein
MAILNLAKQIRVVGKAFRSAMTVVKIYISMNPIELNAEITKFIINDCLPPQIKYPVKYTVYIDNIFYLNIKIR